MDLVLRSANQGKGKGVLFSGFGQGSRVLYTSSFSWRLAERNKEISVLFKITASGIPVVAQPVMNPTSIHEDAGLIPGHIQ